MLKYYDEISYKWPNSQCVASFKYFGIESYTLYRLIQQKVYERKSVYSKMFFDGVFLSIYSHLLSKLELFLDDPVDQPCT